MYSSSFPPSDVVLSSDADYMTRRQIKDLYAIPSTFDFRKVPSIPVLNPHNPKYAPMRLYKYTDVLAQWEVNKSTLECNEGKDKSSFSRDKSSLSRGKSSLTFPSKAVSISIHKSVAQIRKEQDKKDGAIAKRECISAIASMRRSQKIRDEAYNYLVDGVIDYSCQLTALPDNLLEKIGEHLVENVHPFDINGPDIVSRDLASVKIAGKALKPLYDRGLSHMKHICERKTGGEGFNTLMSGIFRGSVNCFLSCRDPEALKRMVRFIKNPMKLNMSELRSISKMTDETYRWYSLPKALLIDKLVRSMNLSPYMYGRFPCEDESDILFLRHIIYARAYSVMTLFDIDTMIACTTRSIDVNLSPFTPIHTLRKELVSKGIFSKETIMMKKIYDGMSWKAKTRERANSKTREKTKKSPMKSERS